MVYTPPLPYRLTLDDQLFLFINHLPHNGLLDTLALTLSGIGTAGMVWIFLGAILFIREERKDIRFFIPMSAAGIIAGGAVEIIKNIIARPRPTDYINAFVISSTHGYSFPSGHATIAFAMAVVLSQKKPKWKWLFYTLAVLISLSRVYLGVHYPLDIAAGALLGWGIGKLVNRLL